MINNPPLLEIIDVFRAKIMREINYKYLFIENTLKNNYVFEIKYKILIIYQFLSFRMIGN